MSVITMDNNFSIHNFVSPCCNAFNYYVGYNVICSNCGKVITTLTNDEELTINIKFNEYNDKSNISGDVVKIFDYTAQRFAHDRTCERIKKKCPKCGHAYARYLRNPQDKLIFVCEQCRYVMS